MKIVAHCAVWFLAFCAVLVSPVILIFCVPLAIGVTADVWEMGAGPLLAVLVASTLACLLASKPPMRAFAKTLLRSAAPVGGAKRLAAAAAARQAAKSIS